MSVFIIVWNARVVITQCPSESLPSLPSLVTLVQALITTASWTIAVDFNSSLWSQVSLEL